MGRATRIVLVCVSIFFSALLLAAGGTLVWLSTAAGRDTVLAGATRAAQSGGLRLTLTDVEGGLLSRLTIGEVVLSDEAGRWLAAKEVRVMWRPTRLLGAQLHVVELLAEEMTLSRLPMMPPDGTNGQNSGMPSVPFAIKVDRLHVDRLNIGEPVVGLAASLGLTAGMTLERGVASLTLDVQRFDAPGGIAAIAAYNVAQDRLTLDLRAEEPSGGLTARLLALPGLPAMRMTVAGEGPLSRWRGRFEAALDGHEWIALDGAIDGVGRASRVMLVGHVVAAPLIGLVPTPAMAALGDLVAVDVRAILALDRIQLEELRATSTVATLTATGHYRPRDADWHAVADVTMAPEALAGFGMVAQGVAAFIEAKGAAGGLEGSLSLRADRLSASGATVEEASLNAVIAGRNGGFDATVRLDGRVTELPGGESFATLHGPFAVDAHAALHGDALVIETVTAELGALRLSASGRYADEALRAALDLRLHDAVSLVPVMPAGRLGDVRLTGDLRIDRREGIRVEDMALETVLGRMRGHVRLSPDFTQLDAALGGSALKLDVAARAFDLPLSGELRLDIAAKGAVTDPQATVEAELYQGRFAGQGLPPLLLQGEAAALVSAQEGQVNLTARPPQGAITLSGRMAVANARLALRDMHLVGPGVKGQGEVALPLGGGPAEGRVSLDAEDLAPLLGIAGFEGGGALDATLTLGRHGTDQTLRGVVAGRGLALRQEGESSFVAKRLRGNILLSGAQVLDLSISAQNVLSGAAALDQMTLAAKGSVASLTYDLSLRAAKYGDLSLSLSGSGGLESEAYRVTVARGGGSVIGKSFSFQPGATARIAPEDFRLAGLQVAGEGLGTLTADIATARGRLDGTVVLQGMDITILNAVVPGGLRGELNFAARLAGTQVRPIGDATLTIVGLQLTEVSDTLPADLDVRLSLGATAAEVDLRMSGIGDAPLRLDGRIGRLPGGLGFDDASPLSAQIDWRGDVAAIVSLLPFIGQRITGDLTADLAATGTLGAPVATGSLSLANGLFEDYATGLLLRFDRLEAVGDGRHIQLKPFLARDPKGGTITGDGRMTLDGAFPFAARIDLTRAHVLERDDIKAAVSGRISAEGTMREAQVRGVLTSDGVEIDIGAGLPPSVTTIEVIEVGGDYPVPAAASRRGAEDEAKKKSNSVGTTIALDVTLELPGQVFVRGRGLESEWSGRIAVAGTAAAPRVTGQLQPRRGTFDIVGKLFRLQTGRVDLAPGAGGDIDVSLNVAALHQARDFQAIVAVTGSPGMPSLTLSSLPAYPQDEILSRLLFNKSRGALSPLEALQLAQGLRTLTGGGGPDPIAALRRATGVDVLRVDSGEANSGPSLEAGKYLSDDIYVGVRQGATPGSSAVGIEVDLTDRLKLRNETRQDGGNSLGLKYQFDY